jgi:S1-C subfamily serine protease
MLHKGIRILPWLLASVAASLCVAAYFGASMQTSAVMEPMFTLPLPPGQEIGVVVQDVTPEIAAAFGLRQNRGVVVTALDSGTLQAGDVILSLNGQPVGTRRELEMLIAGISPSDSLIFQVSRGGTTRDIVVQKTAAAPEQNQTVPLAIAPGFRGLRVTNATAGSFEGGVVVTELEKGTPADAAGLRLGDIVVEVNHLPVMSVEQFVNHVQKLSGQRVDLSVIRQGIFSIVVVPSTY